MLSEENKCAHRYDDRKPMIWLSSFSLTVLIVTVAIPLISVPSVSASLFTFNITCPTGWQQALNNCYLFNTQDQVTWDNARTECSLLNADLMVIRNREELNWLNIQTEEYTTDEWWVGLKYRANWDWVQYGGDKSLINWRNEPDNYDDQDCCAINEFGLFSDEYCRSKLGFICKYPIQRGDVSCPSGENSPWLLTDTACYFISPLLNTSLHLNWAQAKQYCSNLKPDKGTQLMSLNSPDDKLAMQSLLSSYANSILLPWWTGLNDMQTEGAYYWADGTLANGSLISWDSSPSQDRSKRQNCGVMYQGGSIDDVNCNKRAHYVCEMSAFQGHLNLGCGSWLRGGPSCYLLGKGKGYTWSDASDKCTGASSHLLKVDTIDERLWIENLDLGPIGFWTGLTRADNQYGWAWQDNSLPSDSFVRWSTEPNNNGGQENCVEIHRDGLYNDRICSAKTGFICEYPLPYGSPCIPGWIKCQQSCYYFSPANNSFAVTWYEAQQKCMDLVAGQGFSAYRLAVNDKNEQQCILTQLLAQPQGAPGYWTDLNDLQLRGYWQYSQAVNNPPNMGVISWAHEPNNAKGNESCAVLYNTGSYNDLNCAAKAFYICERPASTLSSSIGKQAPVFSLILITISFGICIRRLLHI